MASFFSELKRRNVFKVGVAYAIVAWLLIQIAAIVLPAYQAPGWVMPIFLTLIAFGFPVALILAWAFELTPEGIKTTKSVDPDVSITRNTGQKLNIVIIGLLLVAVIFMFVDNYLPGQRDQSANVTEGQRLPNSVAMLPCDNLSQDPEDAFFAAGFHDSTLNQLAKIRDINLIARNTVMQYENSPLPIPEIAEALNVEMIIECSVQYANNKVLITVQFIDGITGIHLDSNQHQGDLTDIFSVQAEIAKNIANALQAELIPDEQRRINKIQTNSPEALTLYFRASETNYSRTGGAMGPTDDLQEYLESALKLDPGFARAHGLKAIDYAGAILRGRENEDPDINELERLALSHASRALVLDPDESLSYLTIGIIHAFRWLFPDTRAAYEKALELEPNNDTILRTYAHFMSGQGEFDKAIDLAKKAVALNPSDIVLGHIYRRAGRFNEAYIAYTDNLRLNADDRSAHWGLAIAEWHLGNSEDAYNHIEMSENLTNLENPEALSGLIHVYGILNRKEDAERLFEKLQVVSTQNAVSAAQWARAYLGIRDYEQAISWLKIMEQERNIEDAFRSVMMVINENHDPVLDQTEFIAIRKSLGSINRQ